MAEGLGWQYQRTRGDHLIYTFPRAERNLSIPAHRELREGLVRSLIATMGITVDEFLKVARK